MNSVIIKARRSSIIKKLLLSLLILTISISCLAGCSVAPITEFNSVAEVQEAIKASPEMILPDISGYKYAENSYFMVGYIKSKKIPAMYGISGKINNSDSELSELNLSCKIINYYAERGTVFEDLNLNAEYFGKQISENIVNDTENPDAWQFGDLAEGSWIYSFVYAFDLGECRYVVASNLVIPPDKQENLNVDEKIEKIKNELLQIVKQIIEKGE